MSSIKKNKAVADKIIDILRSGLTMNSDTLHYIDSTFSNPSIGELKKLLQDESSCETDPLIELLLFPDESVQLQLEELIDAVCFEKHDNQAIQEIVCTRLLKTRICFPDGRGSFGMALSPSNVAQFIARLNLSRLLDSKLRSAIAKYVDKRLQARCKVRLRNARPILSPNHILFLIDFFKKLRIDPDEFLDCLDFILSFLDELKDEPDMFQVLMAKKRFYFWSLQKAKNLDIQLSKHNVETLLLKGKRVSYVDKADARKKIQMMDRICLAIFGKTEFIDLMPADAQSITLNGKADIDKLFRGGFNPSRNNTQ
jgi:hypothetical protein